MCFPLASSLHPTLQFRNLHQVSMGKQLNKKITWVIKNFSSLQSEKICSDHFVVGGCKWHILACPKQVDINYLSLYLVADNYESLPTGWRRHAKICLILVNRRSEDLSMRFDFQQWFDVHSPRCGRLFMFPLNQFRVKDSRFLLNGELKIVAEIEVLEVIGKLDVPEEDASTILETMDVNGFQLLPSQVESVKCIFERHPDFASKVRPNNRHLKLTYMNVLLELIETLCQLPEMLSEEDLDEASSALTYLENVGFKLNWLEKKLAEVTARKKKVENGKARRKQIKEELEKLNQKVFEMKALLDKEYADVSHNNVPFSFDDVV